MAFENFLDPVFSPLLYLHPFISVTILSFLISLIIIVIYKYTTNQTLMKSLKDELKALQAEMKLLKDQPQKMMEVNKRAMETNMKYMMHSFRSTLFTFIPIIFIFSWMSANYAYEPIAPGENFQVNLIFDKGFGNVSVVVPEGVQVLGENLQKIEKDRASFILKGNEGKYIGKDSLKFEYDEKVFFKDILITEKQKYAPKDTPIKNSNLKMISIDYKKKIILPGLNWGWLGTYILLSIVFSMLLRKVMKVY